MSDKPVEVHDLPGYAGSQAMTRLIQINVFPWQIRKISPVMLQTKKEFFYCGQGTPWYGTQSELWAVWACSLQFSHPISTTLKPWRSSHFFTDVVCTSGARGKDRTLFCHFSFVIETENSLSLEEHLQRALVFYHSAKGHGVPKNWKAPDMQLRLLIFSLHLLLTGMALTEQIPSLNLVAGSTGIPEAFCLPGFPHTWLKIAES